MWSPCSPFAQLRSKELSKGVLCIFNIGEVGGMGWSTYKGIDDESVLECGWIPYGCGICIVVGICVYVVHV